MFNLNDYDCIGFDLDNTLCEYNEEELAQLTYCILATYLVNQKKYDSELLRPINPDIDFLRKGLTLDLEKGNTLDIAYDGTILKACHGTKFLTNSEIESVYGKNRKWSLASHHCTNLLSTWNGELSEKIRSCSDYFDLVVPLLFARAIDSVDKLKNGGNYTVWPDILSGLCCMFQKEYFQADKGEYFPNVKKNPYTYLQKCSPALLKWIESIKSSNKITFLITGSNTDYGSFIAESVLGSGWQKYFDIIIYYARKPGFFVQKRPFYTALQDFTKDTEVQELTRNGSYTFGNWQDLLEFFKKETGKNEPKCLYIGDNLVQDVYAPNSYKCCDTVAVVKELFAETENVNKLLISKSWGSFFYNKENEKYTIWGKLISQYSKICVPNLEWFVSKPIDMNLPEFEHHDEKREHKFNLSGFQVLIPPFFV